LLLAIRRCIIFPLSDIETQREPTFGLEVPVTVADVPSELLNPRNIWKAQGDYDRKARELANMFVNALATCPCVALPCTGDQEFCDCRF
jgi:ATP-dependent phosphoenolpyruvate carboxykinase